MLPVLYDLLVGIQPNQKMPLVDNFFVVILFVKHLFKRFVHRKVQMTCTEPASELSQLIKPLVIKTIACHDPLFCLVSLNMLRQAFVIQNAEKT